MKKIATILSLLILFVSFTCLIKEVPTENSVNVYGWYGIISKSVLEEFEKETGIKVVYDVYDNNDTLEAKLLATNSGYDIVFPSFIPYAARQSSMGAYMKLDKTLIPNLKNIGGIVTDKFYASGADYDRLIPIFWGTTGIAYNDVLISSALPNEVVSIDTIFNPSKVKKIKKLGISFPEESVDIFPQLKKYLHLQTPHKSQEDIKSYLEHFQKIRQCIKKFSTSTIINDLISGEIAIAIGSSDNAWRAIRTAKSIGKRLKYIIPQGAGTLWVDCICIPEKAPHKENAHKFINFLLRPEIAAKITNESGILVNIPEATKFFRKSIITDEQICPTDPNILNSLMIGSPSKSIEELDYDRSATRAWAQIKVNEISLR